MSPVQSPIGRCGTYTVKNRDLWFSQYFRFRIGSLCHLFSDLHFCTLLIKRFAAARALSESPCLRPSGCAEQLQKGGVPAAPSGTATLLRLSPSHQFYLRALLLRSRTSGTPGFHGLTGGVYKARERIHRAMADARLLANPASWSRVADSNPN